jgi:hypothetical protein
MIIASVNAKTIIISPHLFPHLFAASMKQLIRYAINKTDS